MVRREKFSNRIFEYRKKLGISQKELAHRVGHKDQSLVSKWESGTKAPDFFSLWKLKSALCLPSIEYLFPEHVRAAQEEVNPRKETFSSNKIFYGEQFAPIQ